MAKRRIGRVPRPLGIMAHSRWVLAAMGGYELGLERARAAPLRLKELAMIKTAMEVGCRFCIDIGAAIACKSGITEEELRGLLDPEHSDALSTLDKQVIAYAVAMSGCPVVIPDDLFAALHAQLGDEAMVELTAAIAWENHRARFNHAVGAKEEGFSNSTLCLLPAVAHG